MSDYRRPGVYLEEVLSTQPTQAGSAVAVAAFAGVCAKGPIFEATPVLSWSDFVQKFGGFELVSVSDTGTPGTLMSYLPYAVFSYYQNGGRTAYIVRVAPASLSAQGTVAEIDVPDDGTTATATCFTVQASGNGTWGNGFDVNLVSQTTFGTTTVFTLQVRQTIGTVTTVLETFTNLTMTGAEGTRPVVAALNDPLAGSRYVQALTGDSTPAQNPKLGVFGLTGGADGATPTSQDLTGPDVIDAMRQIEAPLVCSFQPFRDTTGANVMPSATSGVTTSLNNNRGDCFVVWDGHALADAGSDYVADAIQMAGSIGSADTYSAFYVPWVVTPDPALPGGTITVPPSGSVVGMIARIDVTIGPWRAPAGIPAVLSTAVQAEVRFSDTDQGQLNATNINIIRVVPGSGICVMGARTRKLYGPDRYVSARRMLIYIEESLKTNTQWAVFENNDQRLWSSLRITAENLLRPLWERGGLAGNAAADAFYVVCDASINTPQVVGSGEVRMEVGVAVQYPAEFIVIRISQFDSGSAALELTPTA